LAKVDVQDWSGLGGQVYSVDLAVCNETSNPPAMTAVDAWQNPACGGAFEQFRLFETVVEKKSVIGRNCFRLRTGALSGDASEAP
jgi:hypothetical protein